MRRQGKKTFREDHKKARQCGLTKEINNIKEESYVYTLKGIES